jgi:hypothetical protein
MSAVGGIATEAAAPTAASASRVAPRIDPRFFWFYATVVAIQGIHVFEHVVQLVQVFVLKVPEAKALGILGYIFQFQGTEEWLHLVFNVSYVVALIVIAWGFFLSPAARAMVPGPALTTFLVLGVGLELWHVNEHIVIISHAIANNGCAIDGCPGILDQRLGISDTVLHFFYNAIAYTGTVIPFVFLLRQSRRQSSGTPRILS